VPVNILALIAAFPASIGFGLTVFYTGWHCPILHVFTDMRFNELFGIVILYQRVYPELIHFLVDHSFPFQFFFGRILKKMESFW
jgi:hypothetical protein